LPPPAYRHQRQAELCLEQGDAGDPHGLGGLPI
jgi:hypothetical protein